jgi:hypothetical protein
VRRCRHDRRQVGHQEVRGPGLHRDMVRLRPGAAGHGKAWRGHLTRVLSSCRR